MCSSDFQPIGSGAFKRQSMYLVGFRFVQGDHERTLQRRRVTHDNHGMWKGSVSSRAIELTTPFPHTMGRPQEAFVVRQ